MRILLLNQAFYPDVVATAQQSSDLAARLAERGHEVQVLTSNRAYDDPRRRFSRHEKWRGVAIRRISSLGLGKKSKWRRAADFASYVVRTLAQLAVSPKFDLVIAMTSPPLISWVGAWFTRLKGGRFVFWVMDLNPDEAIAAGWLDGNSWTAKRLGRMLQVSLNGAERVIVLDRFMADRVAAKGISRERISIVQPWSNDDIVHFDAGGRDRFRSEHQLDGKFVVMYSGNHSPCHPLDSLLEAARRLASHGEILFCFVGGGSEFQGVQDFAREHALPNVRTIPYQPLSQLSASLSAADLHAVVMGDPFVGLIHPCKVYNIRRLGIPYLYIGPSPSHVSEMNPRYSAGHRDVDAVVRHIVAAADSGASPMKTDATDVTEHSQDRLVAKMVGLLEASADGVHAATSKQPVSTPAE